MSTNENFKKTYKSTKSKKYNYQSKISNKSKLSVSIDTEGKLPDESNKLKFNLKKPDDKIAQNLKVSPHREKVSGSRETPNQKLKVLDLNQGNEAFLQTKNLNKSFNLDSNQIVVENISETYQIISKVADTTPFIFYILDVESLKFVYINNAIKSVLGYEPEEVLSSESEYILSRFDPEHLKLRFQRQKKDLKELMVGKTVESIYRVKNGNDEYVWVKIREISYKIENNVLKEVLGIIEDVTDTQILQQKLIKQAYFDSLTGLPNRALFLDELQKSFDLLHSDLNIKYAVLFLDLDRFKMINDSYGHILADDLLIEISKRLTQCVSETDVIARLGGDEFTVLVRNVKHIKQIYNIAEKIKEKLTKPFKIRYQNIYVTPSIGIAWGDKRYTNIDDVIRDADIAMYKSKELGTGSIAVFDKKMHQSIVHTLKIESKLRNAFNCNEIAVYYQPIFNLKTEKIIGYEALARWEDPVEGTLSPDKFIKEAQNCGLIVDLDKIILEKVCKQLKLWEKEGFKPGFISLNVSTLHFRQQLILDSLKNAIKKYCINPEEIYLEITESVLLEEVSKAVSTMNLIRDLGIRLSVDDFGTGYSSLSYLKDLPIKNLKIDRSFIHSLETDKSSKAIVKTIINLAHGLGISVTAEGVENEEQLKFLTSINCENLQGFIKSKPLKASLVTEFSKKHLKN